MVSSMRGLFGLIRKDSGTLPADGWIEYRRGGQEMKSIVVPNRQFLTGYNNNPCVKASDMGQGDHERSMDLAECGRRQRLDKIQQSREYHIDTVGRHYPAIVLTSFDIPDLAKDKLLISVVVA